NRGPERGTSHERHRLFTKSVDGQEKLFGFDVIRLAIAHQCLHDLLVVVADNDLTPVVGIKDVDQLIFPVGTALSMPLALRQPASHRDDGPRLDGIGESRTSEAADLML